MDEDRPGYFPPDTKNRQQEDLENLFKRLLRGSEQVILCPNCKHSFNLKVLQKEWIRNWMLTESSNPDRKSLSSRKLKGQTRSETAKSQGKSLSSRSRNPKSRLNVRSDQDSGQLISQYSESKLSSPNAESQLLALIIPESRAIVERYKFLMSQWHQTILFRPDREPNSSKTPVNSRTGVEYTAKQGFGSLSQQDQFGNVIKATFVDHKPHGLVIEDNGSTTEVYYSIMGKRNGPYLCKFASGLVSYGCYCEDQRFGLWGFVHPDESFEQVNHGFDVLQNKIY